MGSGRNQIDRAGFGPGGRGAPGKLAAHDGREIVLQLAFNVLADVAGIGDAADLGKVDSLYSSSGCQLKITLSILSTITVNVITNG